MFFFSGRINYLLCLFKPPWFLHESDLIYKYSLFYFPDGESSQTSTTTTIFISECLCEIHDSSNRIRCGLFLTVLIAVTSVSATYLAQSTYYGEFNAPYFVTYFSTAWLILMYPIYTLILFIYSKGAYSPKHAIR